MWYWQQTLSHISTPSFTHIHTIWPLSNISCSLSFAQSEWNGKPDGADRVRQRKPCVCVFFLVFLVSIMKNFHTIISSCIGIFLSVHRSWNMSPHIFRSKHMFDRFSDLLFFFACTQHSPMLQWCASRENLALTHSRLSSVSTLEVFLPRFAFWYIFWRQHSFYSMCSCSVRFHYPLLRQQKHRLQH